MYIVHLRPRKRLGLALDIYKVFGKTLIFLRESLQPLDYVSDLKDEFTESVLSVFNYGVTHKRWGLKDDLKLLNRTIWL